MTTVPMAAAITERSVIDPPVQPTPTLQAVGIPAVAAVVGAGILASAYLAAGTDAVHWMRYPLYWIGILTAFLPAAFSLVRSELSSRGRASLIVLLSVVTFLPRMFHGSIRPLTLDEMMHWYQTNQVAEGASLFHPNPIVPAISHYPGFEALVVGLHAATALPTWVAGLIVVGIAHIALLFGIYTLAKELTGSVRLAATATALYAAAPGFTFFTVLVAYESVGLPLMVWALVFAVKAAGNAQHRIRNLVVAVITIAAVVVTHQLSSVFLMLFLGVLLIAGIVRSVRGHRGWREVQVYAPLLAFALAFNIVWVVMQDWNPVGYLAPGRPTFASMLGHLRNLQSLLTGQSPTHLPFEASGLPVYERIAGVLAPVIITLLCAAGFFLGRIRFQHRPELRWALAAIYLLYPLTFIGVFNGVAGSWVHRPWPFLYVGIVILAAVGVQALLTEIRERDWGTTWRTTTLTSHRKSLVATVAVLGSIGVLFMGNTANDVNDRNRFDGQWVAGSEARSTTPEMLAMASWLRGYAGDNARILSDKDTATNMLAYANAYPVQHIETWELTETTAPVTAKTLGAMYALEVDYVIVDQRMATDLNLRGYWYGGRDPQALTQTEPFPIAAVDRLATMPWASQVFATEHMRVYQIDRFGLAEAYLAVR